MLAATLLAVLIVPVLYVVVETLVERWSKKGTKTASQPEPVAELVR